MAWVRFWVPDELKETMDEHEEINWGSVLRQFLSNEITKLEDQNVALAVATSERLSREIDHEAVANDNIADVIRRFRDIPDSTEPS